MVLGGATLTIRDFAAAIEAFREVVRLDPQRIEAWTMPVRFADAMDGRAVALEALDEAIVAAGQGPDLFVSQICLAIDFGCPRSRANW